MVKSDSCFLKQFDNKLSIKNKNTMKEKNQNPDKIRAIYNFRGLDVIDIKDNLNISTDVYNFERELVGKTDLD